MKVTAQEQYGLRILLRIAACKERDGMNIPQLSEAEGLSSHYAAKLTRLLRMGGFINSTPGNKGGYVLAVPAQEIIINNVLKTLGGAIYDKEFCASHAGALKLCTRSIDCSSRSLWQMIQFILDRFLDQVTLYDLINTERDSAKVFEQMLSMSSLAEKEFD